MKTVHYFTGLLLISLFSGCASNRQTLQPKVAIFDSPSIGDINLTELGETIVSKGKVFTYDGIELRNQVHFGDGFLLKRFTVPPGKLLARQEDNAWIYYYSDEFKVYDALLGESLQTGGLKISKTNQNIAKIFNAQSGGGLTPSPKPEYSKIQINAVNRQSFRQELIYNGRIGSHVKFLYREFSNDLLRGPFSQEIQYDLNEGNGIGFKGARIEIIEASNTQIKYKVLKNFPDTF